jgi:hypothetical protein
MMHRVDSRMLILDLSNLSVFCELKSFFEGDFSSWCWLSRSCCLRSPPAMSSSISSVVAYFLLFFFSLITSGEVLRCSLSFLEMMPFRSSVTHCTKVSCDLFINGFSTKRLNGCLDPSVRHFCRKLYASGLQRR